MSEINDFQEAIKLYDNEYKCLDCFLIPFISIYLENNILYIKMKCENNHENCIDYNLFQYKIKNKEHDNIECQKCGKIQNKIYFFYCGTCSKILCYNCKEMHKILNENHKFVELINLDNTCLEHYKNFIGYCKTHNKNYCELCTHSKEKNLLILNKLLDDNEINSIKSNNNNNLNILNNIDKFFENLKITINKLENNYNIYKENIKNKLNVFNTIISLYEKKNYENKTNYQMIQNIKNNTFSLKEIENQLNQNINQILNICENITKNLNKKEFNNLNLTEKVNTQQHNRKNKIEKSKTLMAKNIKFDNNKVIINTNKAISNKKIVNVNNNKSKINNNNNKNNKIDNNNKNEKTNTNTNKENINKNEILNNNKKDNKQNMDNINIDLNENLKNELNLENNINNSNNNIKNNNIFKDSKILTDKNLIINLINFLPIYNSSKKFKLIYSASRDGDLAKNFYQNCMYKSPTITILKNIDGLIIGGYTEKNWDIEIENNYDDLSFIFDLTKNQKYEGKKNKACIFTTLKEHGPCFGKFGNDLFTNEPFLNNPINGIDTAISYNYSGKRIVNKLEELEVFLIK